MKAFTGITERCLIKGYKAGYRPDGICFKQGAKLQQARLIGASEAVNRCRGAFAPAGVGGGSGPTTDGRMAPDA